MPDKNKHSGMTRDRLTLTLVVCMLAFVAWFGSMKQPAEMALAIGACAIGVFALNLTKFEFFKAAGVEARMRKLVTEAEITIEELRSFGKTTLATNVRLLTWSNRAGQLPVGEQIARVNQIVQVQRDLKIDDRDLDSAVEQFFTMLAWDFVSSLLHHLDRFSAKQIDRGPWRARISARGKDLPEAEELKGLLRTVGMEQETAPLEIIADYEYFRTHRSLRGPTAKR